MWLKMNRHLNNMYVSWLNEIQYFRFDGTHLPGSRNPTDPLLRHGFAHSAGPAVSTVNADAVSQQDLISRLASATTASMGEYALMFFFEP